MAATPPLMAAMAILILPTNRTPPLMAAMAILMMSCVGESPRASDREGRTADPPVATEAREANAPEAREPNAPEAREPNAPASDAPGSATSESELPPPPGSWMDVEASLVAAEGGSGDANSAPRAQGAEADDGVSGEAGESRSGDGERPMEAAGDPGSTDEPQEVQTFPAPTATTGEGSPVARLVLPDKPLSFTRPEAVRGIYVNGWAAGSRLRSQNLIDLAKRTELNAFVIDLKDATGYVSHPTQVMFARGVGADQEIRIRDLVGLLERLHEADIYPIARIVIVKDALLVGARPDLAVQDTSGGVWVDDKGLVWANLYNRAVWDYHVALAKEAAAVGFPEIQWDYLRFPDAPQEELDWAWYPGRGARTRSMAVQEFLQYARQELGEWDVNLTADVFGVTTSAHTDVGIGQLWEDFIGAVDVALPMVYPSHYWVGSFDIEDPNAHPYEVVLEALRRGVERSTEIEGAGATRPWLQDFTLGPPTYGAPEVRAQIQATYDAGIDEWILWNPSSRYSEAALAPAGGYPVGTEPTIRVGGKIVAVSERAAAIEAERIARAAADSVASVMAEDTVGIRH